MHISMYIIKIDILTSAFALSLILRNVERLTFSKIGSLTIIVISHVMKYAY